MSSDSSPSLAELSACLLDLHERSREHDFRAMQRYALDRTKATIPFAAAILAQGAFLNGVPVVYDVVLDGRSAAFMESWERVKAEDVVARLAISNPGITVNVDVDGPLFDDCPNVRAHSERFGIAHALCTALVSETTGMFRVMSMYREHGAPFAESQRGAKQALMPHLFSAIRHSRLGQLRGTAHLSHVHGQVAALSTRDGVVLEAEPGFGELVAAKWRGWTGPLLPESLRIAHERGASTTLVEPLLVNLTPADDLVLVHLRRALPADRLTDRERQVADAFSSGETHRVIGERLGISPNTVRRHLANIYEKLGIASKAELDRMISGLG